MRIVIGILLIIAGLTGLFMTACGGFFLGNSFINPHEQYTSGSWVISLPSLLGGLGLLWFVFLRLRKSSKTNTAV